jgi:hypothetical protein
LVRLPISSGTEVNSLPSSCLRIAKHKAHRCQQLPIAYSSLNLALAATGLLLLHTSTHRLVRPCSSDTTVGKAVILLLLSIRHCRPLRSPISGGMLPSMSAVRALCSRRKVQGSSDVVVSVLCVSKLSKHVLPLWVLFCCRCKSHNSGTHSPVTMPFSQRTPCHDSGCLLSVQLATNLLE